MSKTTYQPIVMTQDGEPIAAIIDYAALLLLHPKLDELQALRQAGALPTPAGWQQMCHELVAEGYGEVCEAAA
jgi:hypothetical protein